MTWILTKAAQMPRSKCAWISLSSLDTAIAFYEKFGFCDMTCDDIAEDEDHFQTWMELRNVSVVADLSELEASDEDSIDLEASDEVEVER